MQFEQRKGMIAFRKHELEELFERMKKDPTALDKVYDRMVKPFNMFGAYRHNQVGLLEAAKNKGGRIDTAEIYRLRKSQQ